LRLKGPPVLFESCTEVVPLAGRRAPTHMHASVEVRTKHVNSLPKKKKKKKKSQSV
jgi:hypothetical protein